MKNILAALILRYFRFFAHLQLKKNPNATIIGVTGSSGKSTTCQALAQILRTRGLVKYSPHANSESGIPLDILGLAPRTYSSLDWLRLLALAPLRLLTFEEKFDYYIVEMGIDSPDTPKNMAYLLKIITPHVGVVLNAGLSHSANFDHLVKDTSPTRRQTKLISLIAQEKMRLLIALPQSGTAVLNLDQKELGAHKHKIRARLLTYGKNTQVNLRLLAGSKFLYQGHTYPLPKTGHPASMAAAIAVAASLGIPPRVSLAALATYLLPEGRGRILRGLSDTLLIDSSYNASPTTMYESLAELKKLGRSRHKLAVLGDMRELGISAKLAHKNLADWITRSCDEALLFGPLTHRFTLPVLLSYKFPVHHFTQMSALIAYLRSTLKPKSVVLVKGSQNEILLERAVEAILADPKDVSQLARRGPYWDQVRANMV